MLNNRLSYFLFFLLSLTICQGQTTKGIWTTGGSFQFDMIRSQGETGTVIAIAPELGYAFHGKWMIVGKVNIHLHRQLSIVGHRLNLRYAFLQMKPIECYFGLDYERAERRFLVQGGTSKLTTISIGPFAGYQHFLNKNTALEFELRYPVYRFAKVGENTQKFNGVILPSLALRFYFDSKLDTDTLPKSHQLSAKQWMIGGSIAFGAGDRRQVQRNQPYNQLMPYAAYLISKRWMLGTRLHYSNSSSLDLFSFGATPFGRYYFKQKAKNLFYGEANIKMSFTHTVYNGQKNETKLSERAGGLAVGWSRWIVPNVCFYLQFGSQWSNVYDLPFGEFRFERRNYLHIGLESYL